MWEICVFLCSSVWHMQCSAFTQCFLQTESHISKWKIHIVLEFSPNMSVVLEQIPISKTNISITPKRSLILLCNQLPTPTPRNDHCSDFYYHRLVLPLLALITHEIMKSVQFVSWLLSLMYLSLRFIHVVAFFNCLFLLWLSSIPLHGYTITCFSVFLLVFIMFLAAFGCNV